MKRLLCLLFVIFAAFTAQAQDVPFLKENFPNKKDAFQKALLHYQDGNYEFNNAESYCKYNLYPLFCPESEPLYKSALTFYKKAYAFNSKSAELNYKMGVCYFVQTKTDSAFPYFLNAQNLNLSASPYLPYFLAKSYQYFQQWDSALVYYNQLIEKISSKKLKNFKTEEEVKQSIDECLKGKSMQATIDTSAKVKNLGIKINSKYNDYSPVISKTGYSLLFTSKRPLPNLDEKTIDSLSLEADVFFEDIFISYQNNGEWVKQMHLNDLIRIRGDHYAVVGVSDDGTSVLVYESNHGGDIFSADYTNGMWQGISKLKGAINSGNNEPSACYADGKQYIYFISNRSGGFGSKDIYIVENNGDSWVNAQNLGDVINTQYDEDGVFVTNDHQTIYFASNKPGGLGGFDIYKSEKDTAGNWLPPVNLGLPINSPYDDIFYVLDADEEHGYFSSNRHGGTGKMDLYEVTFGSPQKGRQKNILHLSADITLKGEVELSLAVADAETKSPLEYDLALIEKNSGDVLYLFHASGQLKAKILNGTQYIAKILAEGYLAEEFEFTSVSGASLLFNKLLIKQSEPQLLDIVPDKLFSETFSTAEIEIYDNTGAPINNAELTLKNLQTNQLALSRNTGANNKAIIQLKNGIKYLLTVKADGYQSSSIQLNSKNLSETVYIEAVMSSSKTKASALNLSNKKSFIAKGLLYDYQTNAALNGTIRIYEDSILLAEIPTSDGKFAVALPRGKIYQIEAQSEGYLSHTNLYNSNYSQQFENALMMKKTMPHIKPGSKLAEKIIPFEGYVSQFMTNNQIPATIEFYDPETGELLLSVKTDKNGYFIAALPNNRKYKVTAKAEGYVSQTSSIKLSKLSSRGIIMFDLLSNADAVVSRNTEYAFTEFETSNSFVFAGTVRDYSSGLPLKGLVEILDYASNKISDTLIIAENGSFFKSLDAGKKYYAIIKAEGYNPYTFSLKDVENEFLFAEIKLMPAQLSIGSKGSAIVGNIDLSEESAETASAANAPAQAEKQYLNIHFAFNQFDVQKEFESELVKLVSVLKKSESKIQLNGHTDSDGPEWYNQKLSASRAKSVSQFLIQHGIEASRINTRGYGESKPIASNDTPQNKYLNRRVEVLILPK